MKEHIKKQEIEEMARDITKSIVWCKNDFATVDCLATAKKLIDKRYRKMPDDIGEFTDGYHTFNELYHHRAVLFSVICNMMPEKAWKSKLHDTGDMFDGMFIVGIETEQGQATYHYNIEPYWDMFKVKELEQAPKWDGHTAKQAIARIGGVNRKQSDGEWIAKTVMVRTPSALNHNCSVCGYESAETTPFCPNCGAHMTSVKCVFNEGGFESKVF